MMVKCSSNMYISSIKFSGVMYSIGDKGVSGIKTTILGNIKVYYESGNYILLSANGIEQINIRKYA